MEKNDKTSTDSDLPWWVEREGQINAEWAEEMSNNCQNRRYQ